MSITIMKLTVHYEAHKTFHMMNSFCTSIFYFPLKLLTCFYQDQPARVAKDDTGQAVPG